MGQTVRIERQGGLAILRLEGERANAVDPTLVEDLIAATGELERDDSVRGVLLISGHPKLFSPGFDLIALADWKRPELERFLLRYEEAVRALYALRHPMVSGINGHTVAAGFALALTADYRMLAETAGVGLNTRCPVVEEVDLRIPIPWTLAVLLRSLVAPAQLGRLVLLSRHLEHAEALAVGLVDEVVPYLRFEGRCLERLEELSGQGPAAAISKGFVREAWLREMADPDGARLRRFLDGWFSEPAQAQLRSIATALSYK